MSAPTDIVVVAHWKLDPAELPGVLELAAEMQKQTLKEPGNRGYEVFQSTTVPGQLLLLERYVDLAAIETHRASAHYQDLGVKKIIPLLTDRKVEFFRPEQPPK